METDKIHERVIEIQKNIEIANPKEQAAMLSELLGIASRIEQSLAEVKIDIDIDDVDDDQVNENEE
jgi:hypothetical protein